MDTSGIRPQLPRTDTSAEPTREARTPLTGRRQGQGALGTRYEPDSVELTARAHTEATRSNQQSTAHETEDRFDERRRAAADLRAETAGTVSEANGESVRDVAGKTRTEILANPELAARAQAHSHADTVLEMLQ